MRTKLLFAVAAALFVGSVCLQADEVRLKADTTSTRLVDAVKAGNKAAAIALIQQKIDVNAPEPDGTTALSWAVRQNDVELVDRLIRAGADP